MKIPDSLLERQITISDKGLEEDDLNPWLEVRLMLVISLFFALIYARNQH